jgi:hypothetical protein
MRFAYLILAHENMAQLQALTRRLCPPGSPHRAYLHIDRKSPLAGEAHKLSEANPALRVIAPSTAVHWGHVSQVEATRRLLRAALSDGFNLAHLISGADWPVASLGQIAAQAGDRCWIEAVPDVAAGRMDRFRLDSQWLRPDATRPFDWYRSRVLKEISHRLPRRTSLPWGPWHKGSQWWSLPHDVCTKVLAELDKGFASGRLRATVCPDEHAVQTIVAHHFADRIAGHRRFIIWSGASASPRLLGSTDWPAAIASQAWFARKLSASHDPFFLDLPG